MRKSIVEMLSFLKTQTLRNILVLSTGTVVGQAIPILLQPLLRRLFSVEEFGSYAIYTSILGIVTVVSSLRYEMAVIQPKHDIEAANILSLSLLINLLVCLLILILTIFFESGLASLLSFPAKYSHWLFLAPVSVFLFGSFRSINFWLIRKKAFRFSSYNKIYRRAGEAVSQIAFGISKSGSGLVISEIVGNAVNLIAGVYYMLKKNFSLGLISWRKMFWVADKYSEFPRYNALPSFLDIASLQLPIFIINRTFTKSDVAQFDLSRMILSVALVLVGTAISQVLQQKVAEDRNNALSIKDDFRSMLKLLGILSIMQIAVITLFGPTLFKFIFGPDWEMAGKLSQVLIFSYVAKFIVSPLSIIFISLERIRIYSFWQYSYFLTIVSLFFIRGLSLMNFIYLYVAIEVILYGVCLVLINRAVDKYERDLVNSSFSRGQFI